MSRYILVYFLPLLCVIWSRPDSHEAALLKNCDNGVESVKNKSKLRYKIYG